MPDRPRPILIRALAGRGLLRGIIEAAAREEGTSLAKLTVLSKSDPYRLDTPEGHRNGIWFREVVNRVLAPGREIHLRGLHYLLISQPEDNPIIKPDGTRYINDEPNWLWLQEKPALTGRWLGPGDGTSYVSFLRITDERNDPPRLFVPYQLEPLNGWGEITPAVGHDIHDVLIPTVEACLPTLAAFAPIPVQPYRIIIIGEKSSLAPELQPVAHMVGGELILPTGEASATLVAHMVLKRIINDPRPTIILYFADFDPSGNQMSVSVVRKIQALIDLHGLNVKVRLIPTCLTLEQATEMRLPQSPLRAGDPRADKWREKMGREQTELDALLALYPGRLRQYAEDAVAPFWDPTLQQRAEEARDDWLADAQEQLQASAGYQRARDILIRARRELTPQVTALNQQVHALNRQWLSAQREARAALPDLDELVDTSQIEYPEPETDESDVPEPLYDTDDDFVDATLKLIARKAFEEE